MISSQEHLQKNCIRFTVDNSKMKTGAGNNKKGSAR